MGSIVISSSISIITHLDATDTEFDKSTKHLSAGNFISSTANSALNEQAVVMGLFKFGTKSTRKVKV